MSTIIPQIATRFTPAIFRTHTEIQEIKKQLTTTHKIAYLASYTLGRLIHYLSCGRFCASNVYTLQTKLATLEKSKAECITKTWRLLLTATSISTAIAGYRMHSSAKPATNPAVFQNTCSINDHKSTEPRGMCFINTTERLTSKYPLALVPYNPFL